MNPLFRCHLIRSNVFLLAFRLLMSFDFISSSSLPTGAFRFFFLLPRAVIIKPSSREELCYSLY
ncbi:hypothetical protein KP509_08G064700 [Ceratopteris richardii]|uniref:Secreted protein n=1 Tax=Ceratopteris richardii TaxID=49495 RepID=A0A8T2UDZ2_CERRI|nr:hypothetical protein KP509_08G064700 [Ceratopteris richardii]